MSVLETLHILAAGKRPSAGLLHTIRLEAFGIEVYGEEAVVETFRHAPFEITDDARIVDVGNHVSIFDGQIAIFADVSNGNISRIWRLGDGDPLEGERGISVAFDPDLTQTRGDVLFSSSDHANLERDCVESAIATGHLMLDMFTSYRARAFCIRAFGTKESFATLFAVYHLSGESERTSGYSLSATIWDGTRAKAVNDSVGQDALDLRRWTPYVPA
jgi:hypothetical protein